MGCTRGGAPHFLKAMLLYLVYHMHCYLSSMQLQETQGLTWIHQW